MELKLKLRDLIARYPSIGKLREAPKVRAKLAFELAGLTGQVTTLVRQFEEARGKRAKEIGEKNDKGEMVIPPEKMADFAEEMEELLDAEVTVKAEPVSIPANFEMDGLVAVLADWPGFLVVRE